MNKIFTYNTTFRLNTSEVSWKLPSFQDNSQTVDVNHEVTLTEANDYKPPYTFPIGTHSIKYTVTDKENLQAFCEFFIKIEGMFFFEALRLAPIMPTPFSVFNIRELAENFTFPVR